jgi:hypothetical protein
MRESLNATNWIPSTDGPAGIMSQPTTIDVNFDFRQDTPHGKDPDKHSPTLRSYHRHLWSKPLPDGTIFALDNSTPKAYLYHRSSLGEFVLSSDSVIPTFRRERTLASIFAQIPASERDEFLRLTYTMGGMMVFPSNRVAGKMTINGARGCNRKIKDRFDLTLECIRRYYTGERSPLREVLARYGRFFDLFESFQGYVEFFLLQDLVSANYSAVRFSAPFTEFTGSPVPATLEEYLRYRDLAAKFIAARNARIMTFCSSSAHASTSIVHIHSGHPGAAR